MSSRRTTLALLVAVAVAGCVGGPLGAGSPESPASPDETPTPSPTPCTENRLSPTDPIRDDVEPSPYPDRPETWDESSVRAYVVAFEQAWSRNQQLRSKTKRVTVGVSDVTVSASENGYRVRLASRTNTWYGGPAEGNQTATIVHGDGAYIPVAYTLTEHRLVRAESNFGSTPTAGLRTGRTVRCWTGS